MNKTQRMILMSSGRSNRDSSRDYDRRYNREGYETRAYIDLPNYRYDNGNRDYNRGGYEPTRSDFYDRDGRRHYDDGRYAPMNHIGFIDPEMHHQLEGKHHEYKSGGYSYRQNEKLDRETAEQWVSRMDKADGNGKGGKWTYDQAVQLMRSKGYDYDPAAFYAVINMLHSDYGKTLARYGVTGQDAYAELAKDWIKDDDVAAGDLKTEMYYQCIVK